MDVLVIKYPNVKIKLYWLFLCRWMMTEEKELGLAPTVTQADIDRVVETAKAIAIPNDQQILHILPQEFIIDGQEDVREPLGMSGVRLEVKVHIVTGAVSAAQNIV